jgi:cyclopropane fatty-acyl-phospholipid synthase-like methyltransferase
VTHQPDADPPWSAARAYDAVAARWAAARGPLPAATETLLRQMLAQLPPAPSVLDVGCGSGVPIGRLLAEHGARITGIDASAELLALARRNLPDAALVHGDMRTVEIGERFDGIVAWDSVFHVPREDHAMVFERFARWLRPNGLLMLSLGGSAWEDEAPMLGERFFFSGWEPADELALLEQAGFDVVHAEVDDPSSRGHLAVLASRRAR